jgi:hypothetical protein
MDIDTNKKLVINYELKIYRTVNFEFYINDKLMNNNTDKVFFDLTDLINFSFKNISGDGAIEIIKIVINDMEILPKYLDKANPPTNWIENIDNWTFIMDKPYYSYIQEILGLGEIF